MTQPHPIPNDHRSIHDLVTEHLTQTGDPTPWRQRVIDELTTRKQRGLETYGTILQPNNGRDAARDAFEEALDTSVYLMQLQLEAEMRGDRDAEFYASTLFRSALSLCTRIAYVMHRKENHA